MYELMAHFLYIKIPEEGSRGLQSRPGLCFTVAKHTVQKHQGKIIIINHSVSLPFMSFYPLDISFP